MNVKILKKYFMILGIMVISLIFLGCSTKTVFVDRVVEVPVIEKCKIPKPQLCHYGKATLTEEITQMRMCIKELQSLIKICE